MNTLFKAPRSNQLEPTKLPDQIIPFNPEKLKQIVIRNGFPVHPKSGKIITNEVIKAIADLEEQHPMILQKLAKFTVKTA